MASKLHCEENVFGEFNKATQLKTSLVKYSIEFNDLAASNSVFEAVRQTLHITVCDEKVCGQTMWPRSIPSSVNFASFQKFWREKRFFAVLFLVPLYYICQLFVIKYTNFYYGSITCGITFIMFYNIYY